MPPVDFDSQITHSARFLLNGTVQGHGVRPAVLRLASRLNIKGHVQNTAAGVSIIAGAAHSEQLIRFEDELKHSLPVGTQIKRLSLERSEAEAAHFGRFEIRDSQPGGPVATLVPRDMVTCRQCREELISRQDYRSAYAFISCTDCGPRYSITRSMPWDRTKSSMQPYQLCRRCQREFTDANNRRFHAQTIACQTCGPRLTVSRPDAPNIPHAADRQTLREQKTTDAAILQAAADVILSGGIVGLKGIGGYQLVCDATNDDAVKRIRAGKQRPTKPLAVMVANLDGWDADLSPPEQSILTSVAGPIVLVQNPKNRVTNAGAAVTRLPDFSPRIAPGLSSIGIMLPTSPLHELLIRRIARPLVITSGNVDGEPLARTREEAELQLGDFTDLFLHHNREITNSVDDSVVRVINDTIVTVRCARGLAPLPVAVKSATPILAVGGDLKSAVAFSNGTQSVLGPHIGNLSTIGTRQRFASQIKSLQQLYGTKAEVVAHDLHPDYFTTRWAEQQSIPAIAVQHHHAHVVATMAEHKLLNRQVLGVAFDGTGFGPDGTIWGGEFLLATSGSFQRIGRLAPFALPGGDAAVREPWRTAVSLCIATNNQDLAASVEERWRCCGISQKQVDSISHLAKASSTPRTSSCGRLFDGIAALVLGISTARYEGEPAMLLEAICDEKEQSSYELLLDDSDSLLNLRWDHLLNQLVQDLSASVDAGIIAMRFHRALAGALAQVAERFPEFPVVLSGGCFQNRILSEIAASRLQHHPGGLYLPGEIPPNDGGLAVGQLAVAAAIFEADRNLAEVPLCV